MYFFSNRYKISETFKEVQHRDDARALEKQQKKSLSLVYLLKKWQRLFILCILALSRVITCNWPPKKNSLSLLLSIAVYDERLNFAKPFITWKATSNRYFYFKWGIQRRHQLDTSCGFFLFCFKRYIWADESYNMLNELNSTSLSFGFFSLYWRKDTG